MIQSDSVKWSLYWVFHYPCCFLGNFKDKGVRTFFILPSYKWHVVPRCSAEDRVIWEVTCVLPASHQLDSGVSAEPGRQTLSTCVHSELRETRLDSPSCFSKLAAFYSFPDISSHPSASGEGAIELNPVRTF